MANRNSNYTGRNSVSRSREPGQNKSEQFDGSDSEEVPFESWPPEAPTDGKQGGARMSSF